MGRNTRQFLHKFTDFQDDPFDEDACKTRVCIANLQKLWTLYMQLIDII